MKEQKEVQKSEHREHRKKEKLKVSQLLQEMAENGKLIRSSTVRATNEDGSEANAE